MAAVFYDKVSDREFVGQITVGECDGAITLKSVYITIDFDALRSASERLECQLLSEDALSRVWNASEEDAAWADL